MDIKNPAEPCLVSTPQGFSVSYQNKFLYSKYNPSKTILQTVDSLKLQENTIILCISPVLGYGINELSQKLPENCLLIICEKDRQLYKLTQEHLTPLPKNAVMISYDSLNDLPLILSGELPVKDIEYKPYNYRRVIKIDFSSGADFNQSYYNELLKACTASLMTYWANRVTLVKFGRKYTHNLFSNLKNLSCTEPVENYFNSISKSIIVFGAGESLEQGIPFVKADRNSYYIICADTALKALLANEIVPDACFLEEAQQVITKAFIGTTNINTHFFASLSSIPGLSHFINPENISYYTTQYTQAAFLRELSNKGLLPYQNKPYGSVGLSALFYAVKFRASQEVPVFVYGLDFSYSAGKTHANNTPAHIMRLLQNDRLSCIENFSAAYSGEAFIEEGINGKYYTTPILQKYAQLLNYEFNFNYDKNYINIYNGAKTGLKLVFPYKTAEPSKAPAAPRKEIASKGGEKLTAAYFEHEKETLTYIKEILTGTAALKPQDLEKTLTDLIKPRDYLYLHFPDGYCFSYTQNFLNRIRVEIDYFLKLFE